MIRLICLDVDCTAGVNVDRAPADVRYITFDVELPEIEKWLREPKTSKWTYTTRSVVGAQLLSPKEQP